jgi:allophanate hydrolase
MPEPTTADAAVEAVAEVVAIGGLATVQDRGRPGWRRFGLPAGGVLDPALLAIANTLVGQAADAPAIEFFGAGPTLKATTAPLLLGLAGDAPATLLRADGEQRRLDGWRSVLLQPGEALRVGAPRGARAGVVAVRGLRVPVVLGSASTFVRAGLGGHAGRALAAGDRLHATPLPSAGVGPRVLRQPPKPVPFDRQPIRVVPGPQADFFDPDALAAFLATGWTVTPDADRMGVRLAGPPLKHNARGSEIVSDATVPGSIQVPGNGQPLVLLADGQTAGGYPKIATVASADLARLALAPPGSVLGFAAVSVEQAEDAAREQAAALQRLLAGIEPLTLDGDIDLAALYGGNLVSGMIDALAPA